ncbi:hypothetical protein [Paenibacillus sp. FSL R10-2736]|uniref:hypothetical protein n=1 Tax=Paenibacillus sp. FSL R10-2736 TaxID=2954692 RepID=UPI0030F5F74B
MVIFKQYLSSNLYISDASNEDLGYWSAFVSMGFNPGRDQLTLREAFKLTMFSPCFFLFTSETPLLESPETIDKIIKKINEFMDKGYPKGILWLSDINKDIKIASWLIYQEANIEMQIPISESLSFLIKNEGEISLERSDSIQVDTLLHLWWAGDRGRTYSLAYTNIANIPFSGSKMGCLNFGMNIKTEYLFSHLMVGFHLGLHDGQISHKDRLGLFPLIKSSSYNSLSFKITVDPCNLFTDHVDPLCRTEFLFADTTRRSNFLSQFTTTTGVSVLLEPLTLSEKPARLRLTRTVNKSFIVASPDGDFIITADLGDGEKRTFDLMGGIFGTEGIRCFPNHVIRFEHGHSAFIVYLNGEKPTLADEFVTAWVNFPGQTGTGNSVRYIGEPEGQIKYGQDNIVFPASTLLGGVDPGYHLPSGCLFPVLPYNGVILGRSGSYFDKQNFIDIEKQVLFPTRRSIIIEAQRKESQPPIELSLTVGFGTTYSGSIVSWDKDGRWNEIQLAKYQEVGEQFKITSPTLELQQTMQTNELFLVADVSGKIGVPGPITSDDPKFSNIIEVEGWKFKLNIGQKNNGSFSNILIMKGCTGKKLVDLVKESQTDNWTMKSDFTSDPVELSKWLTTELTAEKVQNNPRYSKLAKVIEDENWLGTILLHADVEMPQDLQGLGCWMKQGFNAHHIIIDKTPVEVVTQNDGSVVIQQNEISSILGLIHYHDSSCTASNNEDNFCVEEMIVYFEGAEVKIFEAKALLTMNNWFNDEVAADSNKLITLAGKRVISDGHIKYQMLIPPETKVSFRTSVFDEILIKEGEFFTSDKHSFIGFNVLAKFSTNIGGLDIFGFSSLGLNGIKLDMFCGPSTPFQFNPSEALPDLDSLIVRARSLIQSLGLNLDGFISGVGNDPLAAFGCIEIKIEGAALPDTNGPWYGLRFNIHLGSLGELVSKSNLKSSLYLIWRPGNNGIAIGITIPGVSPEKATLPLQGVLKLALPQIKLKFDGTNFRLEIEEPELFMLGRKYKGENMTLSLFGSTAATPLTDLSKELAWYGKFGD